MSASNATPKPKASRRTKSSKPGIYYRLRADGRRQYEFVYRGAEARQIWVGGFATIADADDARGEVLRRIRKGERVAPVKVKFGEYAEQWLKSQTQLRDSTLARYQWAISTHLVPRFGRLKLAEISDDAIACLIGDMRQQGYAPATTKAVLGPLSLILGQAVRRGSIGHNAVASLERRERPKGERRVMRILSREDIGALLEATAAKHRPLIATLIFGGMRVSEALGLAWQDIDLERGQIHVRGQLDHKSRVRAATKTASSMRSVVLMPALGRMLAEHRLGSMFSADNDPVFCSNVGTSMNRDNVRSRILRPAVKRAGLAGQGRPVLRTHDLRHCFASLLIAGGADVVFVASQLGHSNPAVTLSTYSHLFDAHEHGARMASILEDVNDRENSPGAIVRIPHPRRGG
jgi:integrase